MAYLSAKFAKINFPMYLFNPRNSIRVGHVVKSLVYTTLFSNMAKCNVSSQDKMPTKSS
jgi:hypothetical protein